MVCFIIIFYDSCKIKAKTHRGIPLKLSLKINQSYSGLKPIFDWKLGLRWLQNTNEINTKKHEMYMANAKNLCLGNTKVPNANGFASQWNIGLRIDTGDLVMVRGTCM